MVTATTAEVNDIVDRVRGWEPASRALLARRIMDTLGSSQISNPPRLLPPDRVFGLLKTNRPAPTDAEVRAIIQEERSKEHA